MRIKKGDCFYTASYNFWDEEDEEILEIPGLAGKVEIDLKKLTVTTIKKVPYRFSNSKEAFLHPHLGFNEDKKGKIIPHKTGRGNVKIVTLDSEARVKYKFYYSRSETGALRKELAKLRKNWKEKSYEHMTMEHFKKLERLFKGRITRLMNKKKNG